MKHYIFPTVSDADAFIADLRSQNVIKPEIGMANYRRAGSAAGTSMTDTMANTAATPFTGTMGMSSDSLADNAVAPGGTPEDAGAGAVKGTGIGAAVGATAGILGAAGALGGLGTAAAATATVATGGLALPLILGMTALGAGVGAAVGGVGGAAGVDETGSRNYDATGTHHYEAQDDHYSQVESATNAGGRAVAVDDSVDSAAVDAAAARHNGRLVA